MYDLTALKAKVTTGQEAVGLQEEWNNLDTDKRRLEKELHDVEARMVQIGTTLGRAGAQLGLTPVIVRPSSLDVSLNLIADIISAIQRQAKLRQKVARSNTRHKSILITAHDHRQVLYKDCPILPGRNPILLEACCSNYRASAGASKKTMAASWRSIVESARPTPCVTVMNTLLAT